MIGKEILLAGLVAFTACTPTRQEPLRPTTPIVGTPRAADAGATPFPTLDPALPRPTPQETAIPLSLDQWRQLPSEERIRRLEKNQTPSLPNFSNLDELAIATVSDWCKRTHCGRNEVTIGFLSPSGFVTALEKELGRKFEPEEANRIAQTRVTKLSQDKTRLLLNTVAIQRYAAALSQLRPDAARSLQRKGIDLTVAAAKTILLQQLLVKNMSEEVYQPSPATKLTLPSQQTITIDKIDGLFVDGNADGQPISSGGMSNILGSIMVEMLCKESGTAYIPIAPYDKAVSMMKTLLESTTLTDQDLVDIFQGKQFVQKLLLGLGSLKNGQADAALGIQAYTIMSLYADNTILSANQAQSLLEHIYGKRLFGPNPPTI